MSEWISVDERLPGDGVPVLILVRRCIMIATVLDGVFVQDTSQAKLYGATPLGNISDTPTHWMPLPPPPESAQ